MYEDTLERGERLSTRQHTLIRLAMAHATWSAHEVAMFAYASAGTVALRVGHAPAAVPRHARRHPAHHLVSAGVPGPRS